MPILTRPRFGAFVFAHPWQSYEIFQPFRWDLYLQSACRPRCFREGVRAEEGALQIQLMQIGVPEE